MHEFIFEFLTAQAIEKQRLRLIDIYREAFAPPPYAKPAAESITFGRWLPEHIGREGFRFAAAQDATILEIAGFAYGYTTKPEHLWHSEVEKGLELEMAAVWLTNCFQLAEFAVLPKVQRQGIGGRLHDLLIKDLPYARAMLSTMQAETAAHKLYQKRGWQTLLEDHYFPGVERPYQILGLKLQNRLLK